MTLSSPRSWRRSMAVGLLAISLAACSTSGTADDAGNSTTSLDPTNTTEGGGPPTTLEEETPTGPGEITDADLEAILPTAAEVGQDYQVKPDTGDDDGSGDDLEAQLADACPGIEEAFDNFGAEGDDGVTVAMETADDRGFEVKLNPSPNIAPETIDEQIDVINGCAAFTYTDDDGSDITIEMAAERTDDFGELSVEFTLDLLIDNDDLPVPVDFTFTSRTFLIGTVSASLTVSDGLDATTLETVGADIDLLEEFSVEMETRVADLLAG